MVKVWFPAFYMRLMKMNKYQTSAVFHIPPKMTKFEVEEYLTKIYDVSVTRVRTANVLGQWKRFYGKRKVIAYRKRDVKIAYVLMDPPKNPPAVL